MDKRSLNEYLLFIYLVLGLFWLKGGLEKILRGEFVNSLGSTLAKFASNNPYPFFKEFLETTAIPNSFTYGQTVMAGEFFVGIALITASIMILTMDEEKKAITNTIILTLFTVGLLGGIFLNIVYYLAAGWMSESINSLNILMLTIQIIGLIAVVSRSRRVSA